MKYFLEKHSGGYSIIAAIMMIGFLLVLTTSTLNLVLQEMQDGRGRQNYMKAYAGAEGAMELGLYKIKQHGYGYYNTLSDSDVLGTGIKDPVLGYEFDGKQNDFTFELKPLQTDIIPLFWIDELGTMYDGNDLSLIATSNIPWNILGTHGGISGIGNIYPSTIVGEKVFDDATKTFDYSLTTTVNSFLSGENYLIVYNPTSTEVDYSITTGIEYFTKPRGILYSQAQVGKYTQNIKTTVDNTEFLGILKYSIYSGD